MNIGYFFFHSLTHATNDLTQNLMRIFVHYCEFKENIKEREITSHPISQQSAKYNIQFFRVLSMGLSCNYELTKNSLLLLVFKVLDKSLVF